MLRTVELSVFVAVISMNESGMLADMADSGVQQCLQCCTPFLGDP